MADIHANFNSDEKMKHLDILNIYKLNLYQILNLLFRVKTNSIPETLQNKFKATEDNYLQDTVNTILKGQISFLGLLNLQYRHVDHVSGISILTNF